jgi:hypothetical protein
VHEENESDGDAARSFHRQQPLGVSRFELVDPAESLGERGAGPDHAAAGCERYAAIRESWLHRLEPWL